MKDRSIWHVPFSSVSGVCFDHKCTVPRRASPRFRVSSSILSSVTSVVTCLCPPAKSIVSSRTCLWMSRPIELTFRSKLSMLVELERRSSMVFSSPGITVDDERWSINELSEDFNAATCLSCYINPVCNSLDTKRSTFLPSVYTVRSVRDVCDFSSRRPCL